MSCTRKIINDPVFGFLNIPDGVLFTILQHPYIQRLNRIRQLGLSFFVYPGAMHSRFLHSLGAMHLMHEAITSLREKGVDITDNEATASMAAILLHDVGHGPFSHVFEEAGMLPDGMSHEDISLMMMYEIRDWFSSSLIALPKERAEASFIMNLAIRIFKDEYEKHFLHQLISSQLDVDRLDYLCRDSFFCGVTEGSVASARILKMMNVKDGRLVVEVKGIYSIEKFLVARRLMYWQVYLHHTSVAAEQLLIKILTRAKQLIHNGVELFASPALKYFLQKNNNTNDLLKWYAALDDSDLLSAIKVWINSGDKVLNVLCECFCNRQLFKGKLLSSSLTEEEREALCNEYIARFGVSKDEAEYFFVEHVSTSNTYSEKGEAIDILYKDGSVRDIAEASEMLNMETLTYKPQKIYLFHLK
ncbi:MAG: HD domain-containing protein [Paludibacteraceae bacterium]|nr:HD domain-containing protein [Paludibacteraceae bacterium]